MSPTNYNHHLFFSTFFYCCPTTVISTSLNPDHPDFPLEPPFMFKSISLQIFFPHKTTYKHISAKTQGGAKADFAVVHMEIIQQLINNKRTHHVSRTHNCEPNLPHPVVSHHR